MPDSFYNKIYRAVQRIPRGMVATYGQVAAMAGNGGAARAVGNALHINPAPGVIPCHRVVNAKGRVAPHFAFGGEGEPEKNSEKIGRAAKNSCPTDLHFLNIYVIIYMIDV